MSLTRRQSIGAAIAATLAPSIIRTGQAAQPAASNQAPGFYRFKVGDLQVTAINDGVWFRTLDGFVRNAPDAEVKQALAAAFLPTDKMTIPFTTLVVKIASAAGTRPVGGNTPPPTAVTLAFAVCGRLLPADAAKCCVVVHVQSASSGATPSQVASLLTVVTPAGPLLANRMLFNVSAGAVLAPRVVPLMQACWVVTSA